MQIADPEHEFSHIGGPGVQLDPQKLMWIDGDEALLRFAQFGQKGNHLPLQPFHHLERDIEEVARSAGRVEHTDIAELAVKLAHKGAGIFILAILGQALDGGLHIAPILAQRVHDRGSHEPFDIGAGRVMRAQFVALAFVERAFQQCAEDGGFDLFPVGLCGLDQQAKLNGVQRKG